MQLSTGGSSSAGISEKSLFPDLSFVSGLLFLVVAGGAIFTRFQLAGFKKNGPMFYFIVEEEFSLFYLL